MSYTDLAHMADKKFFGDQVIPEAYPVVEDGACKESVPTNWGDPRSTSSPCWDYMPVIHFDGNLHLSGNAYGQGILLVDGNLQVTGTFDFYGIVVVQGDADFSGTTSLNGALMVRNGINAGDESSLRGGTTLQYSSCSAAKALQHAIVARPLSGRHWFDVGE